MSGDIRSFSLRFCVSQAVASRLLRKFRCKVTAFERVGQSLHVGILNSRSVKGILLSVNSFSPIAAPHIA